MNRIIALNEDSESDDVSDGDEPIAKEAQVITS